MAEITETDKLTEIYSLRIPEITKIEIDRLPVHFKNQLNHEMGREQ